MKQLYLAYGSNMHKEQMARRCPYAKPIGVTEIKDYKLQFNGVATIVPKENESVPVVVWKITDECEVALDRYEGYPHMYRKEYIDIELNGKTENAMVYIMNSNQKSQPSTYYYDVIDVGYQDFEIDKEPLERALLEVMPICPRCKKQYKERSSLSRKDNMTEICPQCGYEESINAFNDYHNKK